MENLVVLADKRLLFWRKKKLFTEVISLLKKQQYTLTVHYIDVMNISKSESEVIQARSSCIVVLAGGDGFINWMLRHFSFKNNLLAVIPIGTCNLFAHECGYTKNATDIVNQINNKKTANFYCGMVNNTLFTITAGCGFDSQVINNFNWQLKKYFGRCYIALLTFWIVLKKKRVKLEITIDDNIPIAATMILFSKGKYYAGSFNFASNASIFKNELYILHYMSHSIWTDIKIIFYFLLNKLHLLKEVSILSAKKVQISANEIVPIQLDGDNLAKTPAIVELENVARTVIVK